MSVDQLLQGSALARESPIKFCAGDLLDVLTDLRLDIVERGLDGRVLSEALGELASVARDSFGVLEQRESSLEAVPVELSIGASLGCQRAGCVLNLPLRLARVVPGLLCDPDSCFERATQDDRVVVPVHVARGAGVIDAQQALRMIDVNRPHLRPAVHREPVKVCADEPCGPGRHSVQLHGTDERVWLAPDERANSADGTWQSDPVDEDRANLRGGAVPSKVEHLVHRLGLNDLELVLLSGIGLRSEDDQRVLDRSLGVRPKDLPLRRELLAGIDRSPLALLQLDQRTHARDSAAALVPISPLNDSKNLHGRDPPVSRRRRSARRERTRAAAPTRRTASPRPSGRTSRVGTASGSFGDARLASSSRRERRSAAPRTRGATRGAREGSTTTRPRLSTSTSIREAAPSASAIPRSTPRASSPLRVLCLP